MWAVAARLLAPILKGMGKNLIGWFKGFIKTVGPILGRQGPKVRDKVRSTLTKHTGIRKPLHKQLTLIADGVATGTINATTLAWVVVTIVATIGDELFDEVSNTLPKELKEWWENIGPDSGEGEDFLEDVGASYSFLYDSDDDGEFTPEEVQKIAADFSNVISVTGSAGSALEFLASVSRLTRKPEVLPRAFRTLTGSS